MAGHQLAYGLATRGHVVGNRRRHTYNYSGFPTMVLRARLLRGGEPTSRSGIVRGFGPRKYDLGLSTCVTVATRTGLTAVNLPYVTQRTTDAHRDYRPQAPHAVTHHELNRRPVPIGQPIRMTDHF